jgi:hypothetical protein
MQAPRRSWARRITQLPGNVRHQQETSLKVHNVDPHRIMQDRALQASFERRIFTELLFFLILNSYVLPTLAIKHWLVETVLRVLLF